MFSYMGKGYYKTLQHCTQASSEMHDMPIMYTWEGYRHQAYGMCAIT